MGLVDSSLEAKFENHPKFEGHAMPNGEEYQKSVQLNFRYCLGVS